MQIWATYDKDGLEPPDGSVLLTSFPMASTAKMKRLVTELTDASCVFLVEPLANGSWEVYVKPEMTAFVTDVIAILSTLDRS